MGDDTRALVLPFATLAVLVLAIQNGKWGWAAGGGRRGSETGRLDRVRVVFAEYIVQIVDSVLDAARTKLED